MQKTNIRSFFNRVPEYTPQVIKDAATFTGLSIRTVQNHYNGSTFLPTANVLAKLAEFFSYKLGEPVSIEDLLNVRNNVQDIRQMAHDKIAKLHTQKRK